MVFTFDHFWAGFLTIASIALGWLHLGHRQEMSTMKQDIDSAKKSAADANTNLAKHQLYAAETYERADDAERAREISENRIMKRLDEIRDDIKSLKSTPHN